MSKPIYEKSAQLQSHLIKNRSLQFEVEVGAAGSFVESNLGAVEIDTAADGTSTVTLAAADFGDFQKVRTVEVLASGAAAVTASASINGDGDLEIALDSDSDYTTDDDTIELRVAYKLS